MFCVSRQREYRKVSIGSIIDSVMGKVGPIFSTVGGWLEATGLPQQLQEVDVVGLFSNPWFLIPFIGIVGYKIYKQAFRDLIVLVLLVGVWYATGTPYMQDLVVGDKLDMNKVLPVMFGGAAVLGVIIYMFFGRSD